MRIAVKVADVDRVTSDGDVLNRTARKTRQRNSVLGACHRVVRHYDVVWAERWALKRRRGRHYLDKRRIVIAGVVGDGATTSVRFDSCARVLVQGIGRREKHVA